MIRSLLTITALLLGGCLVDTTFPGSAGPPTPEPICGNEMDLYWSKGSPTYCYPDTCCVWEYLDYSGWMCEETWCLYEDPYGCWWENTDIQCWQTWN